MLRSWLPKFVVFFAAIFAGWIVCGIALHSVIVHRNATEQLSDATEQLMRRVEMAVDYVVMAGTEFLVSGHIACNSDTQEFLRKTVLENATVSDVYLITAHETCSGFGILSAQLPEENLRWGWLEALNPEYRIGPLATASNGNYGVSRGLGSDFELVFAVNSDAALFDILPNDLRDHGQVNLRVGEDTLATFTGSTFASSQIENTTTFFSVGSRYPLSIEIEVASSVFPIGKMKFRRRSSWPGAC